MFGRKKLNPGTIDCLIGAGTAIQGDVRFRGGLRIDGAVRGNAIAEDNNQIDDLLVDDDAVEEAFIPPEHKPIEVSPDADLLIATTALVHNLSLATNNQRHYARIPNLTLARWDA